MCSLLRSQRPWGRRLLLPWRPARRAAWRCSYFSWCGRSARLRVYAATTSPASLRRPHENCRNTGYCGIRSWYSFPYTLGQIVFFTDRDAMRAFAGDPAHVACMRWLAEAITAAILYLCSNEAHRVNGALILCTAGHESLWTALGGYTPAGASLLDLCSPVAVPLHAQPPVCYD